MVKNSMIVFLSELRSDSGKSISSIARKSGMKVSTCHSIFMRTAGLFSRFSSVPDYDKIGYSIHMIVATDKTPFMQKIFSESIFVNNLSDSGMILIAECRFRNLCQAHEFAENARKASHNYRHFWVSEEVLRESFLSSGRISDFAEEDILRLQKKRGRCMKKT